MARDILTRKKTGLDASTKAGLRYLCKTDLYAFAKTMCGYSDLSDTFHRPMCDFMQAHPAQYALWLVSRDHFKTSLLTIARNAQRVLNNPQGAILIASNKAENAEGMLSELKGHLANPLLVELFPEILYADPNRESEKWTNSAIVVKRKKRTKEATVETIGAEGELTSKHYDHITFDDLVGFENSQTREQLQKTIKWWRTAQSLLKPTASQDIVGTPWAHGDLYAAIIADWRAGKFKMQPWRQPCFLTKHPGTIRLDVRGNMLPDEYVTDAQGRMLPAFPERYTLEKLKEKKALLEAPEWAAQWILNPNDEETAVFPRSKARIVRRDMIPDPATLWCAMAIDPAISTKAWADYSAIAVVGFDSHGLMYVLDLRRGRWSEDELVNQAYDAYRRTPGIVALGIEALGFQKIYRREFMRAGEKRGYLPLTALERDTKVGKSTRIRSLRPYWNNGEMILAADLHSLDDFLDEAERFRLYRDSTHDDMLDALADTLQMRVRPTEADDESLYDDPAVLERVRFEQALLEKNKTLDKASLRSAFNMHKRRESYEQEREMSASGSEFWG